jgi:hypothetical protein
MGSSLENIARGIDERIIRQPLGVFVRVISGYKLRNCSMGAIASRGIDSP